MSLFTLPSEQLLHYIWQGLRFEHRDLRTTCGKPVEILKTGILNADQGPDFLQSHLRVDGMEFHGHVELHVEGMDWYRHKHHLDPHYNSVILHVTFSNTEQPILCEDGHQIPELVVGDRIAPELFSRYDKLRLSQDQIACETQFRRIPMSRIHPWLDRLAVERMQQKAGRFQELLHQCGQDWEQVLWEELAARLAGPVNEEAFRDVARRLPVGLMNKYLSDPDQLEAMLLGGAGVLHSTASGQITQWKSEWEFLRAKHQITGFSEPVRFLRMRPASFPTFRLSQLAQLWHRLTGLIRLLEAEGITRFLNADIHSSDYWKDHIRPGESAKPATRSLGKSMKSMLIVNVLLPLGWLYQLAHGRENPYEWLERHLLVLPPETNRHTRIFTELGIANSKALQSQALIQLHKEYCLHKRCLDCHLGQYLLDRS